MYGKGVVFSNKIVCEGCETKNSKLIMVSPNEYGFQVECDNCGWNEPVEGLDEFLWYISEALGITIEEFIIGSIDRFMYQYNGD